MVLSSVFSARFFARSSLDFSSLFAEDLILAMSDAPPPKKLRLTPRFGIIANQTMKSKHFFYFFEINFQSFLCSYG
jgi:hypothetical protein